MDTSEEYIKMCEKAHDELIEHWKHEKGDFAYNKSEGLRIGRAYIIGDIWLPRQDQLQEIAGVEPLEYNGEKNISVNSALRRFSGWVTTTGGPDPFFRADYKHQFSSVEQMWLAFVMKEEYNKVWNGEDWVVA